MEYREIEKIMKEIKEREEFLIKLEGGIDLSVSYMSSYDMHAVYYKIFTLSEEEKEFLKDSCKKRVTELRELLKPILT